MARRAAAIILSILLGLALVPATAQAHVSTAGTALGIRKAPKAPVARGERVILFGKLKSPDANCRASKQVVLFRKRPGPDKRMRADMTDAEGEYRFKLPPGRTLRLYTRFQGSVDTSYGHSHTCTASKSTTTTVVVE